MQLTRAVRHRGERVGLPMVGLVFLFAGWPWVKVLAEPELFLWIRMARNDAGEPIEILHLIKQSPAPLQVLGGEIRGASNVSITGLVPIGETYTARWVVNERDIYVVDDIPLRSLVPAGTLDVAGRGKGGSLLTQMTVMPAGRLRLSWTLCPDQSCERSHKRDEDFQGSAEFQGRLEATARYPVDD